MNIILIRKRMVNMVVVSDVTCTLKNVIRFLLSTKLQQLHLKKSLSYLTLLNKDENCSVYIAIETMVLVINELVV